MSSALCFHIPQIQLEPKYNTSVMENMQRAPHLWTAGQERLDINVGVVHFETVVPKSSGNPDGRQHAGLKEDETHF